MFMYRIASLLIRLLQAYELMIIVQAVLSWFPQSYGSVVSDIYHALSTLTDPFVGMFRRILPSSVTGGMGIDFTPVVALFALQLAERLVVAILL